MPAPRILALIPAFNEGHRVAAVVEGARAQLAQVVVVDDGSTDDTAAHAERAGALVLAQRPNRGKGAALRLGFRYALDNGFDAVLTLDADGQHDPQEIPKFVQAHARGVDLVIGSRDFKQMPPVRRFANTVGTWMFSWALGQHVADNQSGYRLLSKRLIPELLAIEEQGYEFEVEMIVVCVLQRFRLEWVPIRTIYGDEVSHIRRGRHVKQFLRLVHQTRRRVRSARRAIVAVAVTCGALCAGLQPLHAEPVRARALPEALPVGYWSSEQSQLILDKTLMIRLAPELAGLTPEERAALDKLIQVGHLFQALYEKSNHHQARAALRDLEALDRKLGSPDATQNLVKLYRLFQGPIATTLDNRREAFVPVDETVPGKNVYPWGVGSQELDAYLSAFPAERNSILHVRTVVRRAERRLVRRDLAVLEHNPTLDVLNWGLRRELDRKLADKSQVFYAVPYAVAFADELLQAYGLLHDAAALLDGRDAALAQYLRLRARDLLAGDYEAGDAAWVTGKFGNLNAMIGAYETYDDELYSSKAFHAVSLLLRDQELSDALRAAIAGLQEYENSLPYPAHKRVREDIPVGVYHVIADFGQARGTNTATILPNEAQIVQKYGRTILLRYNIMTHPELFRSSQQVWRAALHPNMVAGYSSEGDFYRTLWHEIGHYLGPDMTGDRRSLDDALEANSATLEEMKADLVSLFLSKTLHQQGYYSAERLRAVYASGIRRTLRPNQPRREEPYATMQLMQMNFYLENGLLDFEDGKLHIKYERYHDVVAALLERVMALQYAGDKPATDEFIDHYTSWTPELHEVIARNIREAQTQRFRLVYYAELGE